MKLNTKILSLIIIGCFIGSIGLPTFLIDTVKADSVVNLSPTDDAYTYMRYPDNNYGSAEETHARNRYGSSSHPYYWEKNTLIKFDLSLISEVTTIVSAKVKMFYFAYSDNNPSGRDLSLYKLTGSWNEDTITWNTMPTWSDTPSSYATVPSSYGVWMSWDVTEDVQDYLDGSTTFYGWQIMDEETWGEVNIPITRFRTKEYSIDAYHPYLEVTLGSGENLAPVADAGGPYTGFRNQSVQLDGSNSFDLNNDIISWEWDLDDDGEFDDATGETPQHSWSVIGEYTVNLKVTDSDGANDTDTCTVEILNTPPVADAGGPYGGLKDTPIQLDGTDSTDADGSIVSYEWDLDDDGEFDDATGETPQHSWSDAGQHSICLKVTDNDGDFDTDVGTVNIQNQPPVADAGGPYAGKINIELRLDGSASYDPDGSIVLYEWDLDGDGKFDDASIVNPDYSWSEEGTYTISLRVKDNDGEFDIDTASVEIVENLPPTVEIGEPSEGAIVWNTVTISGVADNPDDSEDMLTVFIKIDDGDWMQAEGTSSWVFEWDSSGIDEGLHTISACSYDGELFSPEDSVEVTVLDGPPAPDLECFGDLVWNEVESGSTVYGTFFVRNVGDPGSELNWEISEYPEWGLWSFEPESYSGLTPDDGDLSVEVTVGVPENPFPFFEKHFSGTISVVNSEDTLDAETVQVSLSTPIPESPFLSWINTIIELFYRLIENVRL